MLMRGLNGKSVSSRPPGEHRQPRGCLGLGALRQWWAAKMSSPAGWQDIQNLGNCRDIDNSAIPAEAKMPTKRAPIVKHLRQFISEMPPQNFAPWVNPNNKMKKIIRSQFQGRLESAVQMVQQNLAKEYLVKLMRGIKR